MRSQTRRKRSATCVASYNARACHTAVTDHTDRLQALLVANTADSLDQAKRLTDASARLNIGEIERNVNIPTMALEYLRPAHIGRLRARQVGRQAVDAAGGLDAVIVEFEEVGRPTLVRGANDADVAASGRYWIDPASGAVPRAIVELPIGRYTGWLEVRLALHETLKVWVPTEMAEVCHAGDRRVNGLARYDQFKRLTVSTGEAIRK